MNRARVTLGTVLIASICLVAVPAGAQEPGLRRQGSRHLRRPQSTWSRRHAGAGPRFVTGGRMRRSGRHFRGSRRP